MSCKCMFSELMDSKKMMIEKYEKRESSLEFIKLQNVVIYDFFNPRNTKNKSTYNLAKDLLESRTIKKENKENIKIPLLTSGRAIITAERSTTMKIKDTMKYL